MSEWVARLRSKNESDSWIVKIRLQVVNQEAQEGFTIRDDLLMFKHWYCIGPESGLRQEIMSDLHGLQLGGHAGYFRTLYCI